MTAVASLLVLLAAGFLQGLLPGAAPLGMAKAPLLLSAVIYYALSHGRFTMLFTALAGGLIHDSLGFLPLGATAFCFCAAGLGVQAVRDFLFRDSLLTGIALTAFGAAALTLATWLFLQLGDSGLAPPTGNSGWMIWAKSAGSALLALVAAPPVFVLARGLDRLISATEVAHA